MIEFQYLHVKDRPQFKDQKFDLSKKGIHLILGYNRKTGSNNGVGKSLFFSEIPSFLTHDTFGDVARTDKVRKGSVRFGVKRKGVLHEFERSFSPRETISLFRDGEDLKVKDLAVAKDRMSSIVPYNEEEISSFLYLDLANGTHPLITGSTASRKDFFNKFFKSIDALSDLRKLVDSHSAEIRSSGRRLAEVITSLSALESSLPEDLEGIRDRIKVLTERQSSVQETAQEVSRAITLRLEIDRLGGHEALPENLENSLSSTKKTLRAVTAELEKASRYSVWKSEFASSEEQRSTLLESLSGLTPFEPARYEALDSRLEREREDSKAYDRNLREYESSKSSLTAKIARLEASLGQLQKEAETCPTCGAPYDNEHAQTHLRSVKKSIKALAQELAELVEPSFRPLSEKKVSAFQAEITDMSEHRRLTKELNRIVTPEAPEKPSRSASDLKEEKSRLASKLEQLEEMVTLGSLVRDWNSLSKGIRRRAMKPGAMDELISIGEELSQLKVVVAKAEVVEEQISTLRAEKKELRKKAKDSSACDLLSEAFAPNGVRREMISDVCGLLNQHVNQYASYAFSEDFRFEFDLDTHFSIMVSRKLGKKTEVSDVRKLSGAEKRLFSLVLVVTLLIFMRPDDRPSLLILDEPTATMGEDNKANFIKFLPILNRVIPTIVVITPLKSQDYAELSPTVWTVVKDGSSSTIEPGVVDASNFRGTPKRPKLARSSD